jgi:hypothetical protein
MFIYAIGVERLCVGHVANLCVTRLETMHLTLLSKNLCRTTWCGTNMERCRQMHPLSRMEMMMWTEWMT